MSDGHLRASARAFSNIAFIKYWGNRDNALRIPANSSVSMNLNGLATTTMVTFSKELECDTLVLNGQIAELQMTERVSRHLSVLRELSGSSLFASVKSDTNFPVGCGIASSASAFAALTVAGCAAIGLEFDERQLSRIARLGSGSACRSVPGGFVEWHAGTDHESSYARSLADASHWELTDLIVIVSEHHKDISSTSGHALANSSPLQLARVEDSKRRLDICRQAVFERDFDALADIIELDALMMHSVIMTSSPSFWYWLPTTLSIIQLVREWRASGIPVAFTIDAGPNIHVICAPGVANSLRTQLDGVAGVIRVIAAKPGGPTTIVRTIATDTGSQAGEPPIPQV